MAISVKSRKQKGRNLQNFCAQLCRDFFQLGEKDFKSQSMGVSGKDVQTSHEADKVCFIAFECKATRSIPGTPEMTQAKYNADEGQYGAVVWKPERMGLTKSRIIMELTDFFEVIGKYWDLTPRDKVVPNSCRLCKNQIPKFNGKDFGHTESDIFLEDELETIREWIVCDNNENIKNGNITINRIVDWIKEKNKVENE